MATRRMVLLVIAVTFIVSIASPVFAEDTCDKPKGDPLRKLGRGLSNCLTFPIEIPNQISKTNNNDGPMAAFTYGVVKGLIMSLFRAVVGVYEIGTFPIPFPDSYRPILTDPEFMLESWTA